jgi:hypothetical protein
VENVGMWFGEDVADTGKQLIFDRFKLFAEKKK